MPAIRQPIFEPLDVSISRRLPVKIRTIGLFLILIVAGAMLGDRLARDGGRAIAARPGVVASDLSTTTSTDTGATPITGTVALEPTLTPTVTVTVTPTVTDTAMPTVTASASATVTTSATSKDGPSPTATSKGGPSPTGSGKPGLSPAGSGKGALSPTPRLGFQGNLLPPILPRATRAWRRRTAGPPSLRR